MILCIYSVPNISIILRLSWHIHNDGIIYIIYNVQYAICISNRWWWWCYAHFPCPVTVRNSGLRVVTPFPLSLVFVTQDVEWQDSVSSPGCLTNSSDSGVVQASSVYGQLMVLLGSCRLNITVRSDRFIKNNSDPDACRTTRHRLYKRQSEWDAGKNEVRT